MQTSLLIAAILFVSSVAGHTVLTNIIVNGVVQTSCVRPRATSKYDYPISDITNPSGLQSTYMTCGWPGKTANSASKCSVPTGSTVGFQYHYQGELSDTYYIDPSHKGPCFVYMARSDTGTGPVWFKVYENGYDATSKQFCIDKLRANRGIFEAKIPTDLAPGNYLMRAELLALHEGFELGGAQPYVQCIEITITGSGTVIPSANLVSLPGAYQATDPGIFFDIYDGFKSYPIPGPPVYVAGSVAPTPTPTPTPMPTPTPTPTPMPTPTPAPSATSTSRASSSTTTSRGSTSTSSSGRTSTSTSGKATPPAPVPVPTPTTPTTPSSGACQNEGYMICASSTSYKTCSHGTWSADQSCRSGLHCSPSGNYIYCV